VVRISDEAETVCKQLSAIQTCEATELVVIGSNYKMHERYIAFTWYMVIMVACLGKVRMSKIWQRPGSVIQGKNIFVVFGIGMRVWAYNRCIPLRVGVVHETQLLRFF
jgi:hypothetical protein